MAFAGFPPETLRFLRGLTKNNDKQWFDAHRADYEAYYMGPARDFVEALGARLQKIEPMLTVDARVNKNIFRINRDIRFSKDKTPYKNHLDIWFYEEDERGAGRSGFFFRLQPKRLILGAGMHGFPKRELERYRDAVHEVDSGKPLARLVTRLERAEYSINGESYARMPRGYADIHPRGALLKRKALSVGLDVAHPDELGSAAFVGWCMKHYKKMQPLHRWMVENVH